MRYVPLSCIREGMVVAKSLYNVNNKLLIKAGFPIKRAYLERIRSLGYQGVYVDDVLSEGIEIKDIVNSELRRSAVFAVKDVFDTMSLAPAAISKSVSDKMDATKKFIDSIVYDIMENKNAVVNMVDIKVFDEYTFFHSVNVAILSIVIGQGLKLREKEMYELGLAAVLHDIGKVYVQKDLLLKKEKLTDTEFEVLKTHSESGYKHLKNSYEIPIASYVGVLQHHEKVDGSGYPLRKKNDDISLFGRIICVADVYDALTSNRPYRDAMLPSEAIEYIMAGSGTMFDSKIVKVFVDRIAAYPIGTSVKLSNGTLALVIDNNPGAPLRPILKVYMDKEGNDIPDPTIMDMTDMSLTKSITIIGILK
ncbi:MAG: HD-GYP domain-containing protein [Vallitaleaceae bacterium]|nr:HD-GYP domain-containing protein [Vallitaleaceae bacterium]